MFRPETKYIIILSLINFIATSLTANISDSIEYQPLKQSQSNLRSEIQVSNDDVLTVEHVGSNNEAAASQSNASMRRAASDIYQNQSGLKVINIFVETSKFILPDTQFYKTKDGINANNGLFDSVKVLSKDMRKRILVTGGAGFVGSHLVDSLMLDGHEVIVCDNFMTGRKSNIEHWQNHPNFELINHDVINPVTVNVNEIYHLASPASPVHYLGDPIKTIKTNTIGTINLLELAKRNDARILIASSSEVYGDPEIHPQHETYWGHVNPIGPRSCYDESKRLSESLAIAYNSRENVSIGIARIFNTYGPRMHPNDGRVVSNFIMQALNNQPMTVYGSGEQTRSFQYVSDLVSGLRKLMASDVISPVNLGNPSEMTVHSLALQIKCIISNSSSEIVFKDLPIDDPHRRKPDIRKANKLIDWAPVVELFSGLARTIEYFRQEVQLN